MAKLSIVVLLFLLPLMVSLGSPEVPSWTGVVKAKGHDPFIFLALIDREGKQWRLSGTMVKEMWSVAQGRWVTITGHLGGPDAIIVESWAWAPEKKP